MPEISIDRQALLDAAPDPILVVDQDGTILLANTRVTELFGFVVDELLGQSIEILVPKGLRNTHVQHRQQYFSEPKTRPMGLGLELYACAKDGREIPVEISLSPLQVAQGALAICVVRDITRQKEQRQKLKESEKRFREMLETVQLIAVMIDASGKLVFCNDYLLKITNWQREEIIGKHWIDTFVPADEKEELRRVFRGLQQRGTPLHFENHILTQSGERRLIAWNNTILRDSSGHAIGATSIGVDVSDQKKAQAQLREHKEQLELLVAARTRELQHSHEKLRVSEKLATVGELAAKIAHEIKNPLAGIYATFQILAREVVEGDPKKEVFQNIGVEIKRLDDTVRDLLRFARPSPPKKTLTDFNSFLPSLMESLRQQPDVARHKIHLTLEPDLILSVDQRLMTEAFTNLIINAAQAMPKPGEITITGKKTKDFLQLQIRDQGEGIPQEILVSIFEPFFTTKARGTGLGLSITKQNIHSHNGRLLVDSIQGRGTTFTIQLPLS